ncbi:protein NDUFAF4 homolog [Cimex lectularius]|uniref:Uncharacterized protein n=1 Tax=Cimex lectularius TaxID=79782 RepID=A0A8I6TIP4_CIMLE|nr:protein NDUFAF4 homolog [Cimex lectularius]
MGQVWPRLTKYYYRFNAENRAFRHLDKTTINPSPKHPSTTKYIDNLMSDQKIKKALLMKNEQLDENLKQVYVKSFDPVVQPANKYGKPSEKMRKLPVSRSCNSNHIFSYLEPDSVPEGKLSLSQAMKMITSHQEDPHKFNPAFLSQQYNVPINDIENILTYFSNFNVFIPEQKKEKEKMNVFNIVKKTVLSIEEKKEEKVKKTVLSIEEKKEEKQK